MNQLIYAKSSRRYDQCIPDTVSALSLILIAIILINLVLVIT